MTQREWLKLDACDVKTALLESQRGEWNGDVNLQDGSLDTLQDDCHVRKLVVVNDDHIKAARLMLYDLSKDISFLVDGLMKAIQAFQVSVVMKVGGPSVCHFSHES